MAWNKSSVGHLIRVLPELTLTLIPVADTVLAPPPDTAGLLSLSTLQAARLFSLRSRPHRELPPIDLPPFFDPGKVRPLILVERPVSACRHDDGARLMRYVIWAKSPDTGPIQGEGTWVVEAADIHEAAALIQQTIQSEMWSGGTTWTVRPWTPHDSGVEGQMRIAKTA